MRARKAGETKANGDRAYWTYTAYGKLASHTDLGRQTSTTTHDPFAGTLASITSLRPDPSPGAPAGAMVSARDVRYEYDGAGVPSASVPPKRNLPGPPFFELPCPPLHLRAYRRSIRSSGTSILLAALPFICSPGTGVAAQSVRMSPRCCPVPIAHAHCAVEKLSSE